jgi:hypothetical protein
MKAPLLLWRILIGMSLVLSAVFGGAYLTYSNIKVMVSATV